MTQRLTNRVWARARLPFKSTFELTLATYDGFLERVIGPGPHGSRREVRSWAKTVNDIDRLEKAQAKASKRSSEKLKFSQGQVSSHLAEMNRKSVEKSRV